jgi:hypothetical protein
MCEHRPPVRAEMFRDTRPWVTVDARVDVDCAARLCVGCCSHVTPPIALSGAISCLRDIAGSTTRLPLALEGLFLALTGTIAGTARPSGSMSVYVKY